MRATLQSAAPGDPAISGTFIPAGTGNRGSFVPKLVAVLIGVALIRAIVAGKAGRGGEGRRSHRREMIARLHRELHAEETTPEAEAKA